VRVGADADEVEGIPLELGLKVGVVEVVYDGIVDLGFPRGARLDAGLDVLEA